MNPSSYPNHPDTAARTGKLADAAECPILLVGSKIHTLARLIKTGLTVPEGFYITTQAYREHIRQKAIASIIEAGLRDAGTIEKPDAWLGQVREAITGTRPEPGWVEAIRALYQSMGGRAVAVRSSATMEDSAEHSFAGQHESFLGITDFESCVAAILKCWASLWTPRAFAYRQKNHIEHVKAEMAVLVQVMVRADVAGVVFTANPVTGAAEQMVIESCTGLGKALVDGEISPGRCIVGRDGAIVSQSPAEQAFCYRLDDRDQCVRQTLETESDRGHTLAPEEAGRLAGAAIQIETALGGPQDIEWAVEKGTLFILQSRPVTTRPKAKTFEDRQVWSNANTGEVLPDVVTPMTWAFIQRMLKPLFSSVWRLSGSDLGDSTVIGLVAGRAYFNLNTTVAALWHFPWILRRADGMGDSFGGEAGEAIKKGLLKFTQDDLPDVKGSLWKFIRRLPEAAWKFGVQYRPRRGELLLEIMHLLTDEQNRKDYSKMSDEEMARELLESANSSTAGWDLIMVTGALSAYPVLRFVCNRWLSEQDNKLINKLVRGQGGLEDVQAGFELWDMAKLIQEQPSLQAAFASSQTWEQFRGHIESSPSGRAFLATWEAFMLRHGHHCRGEIELSNPRWSETPDYVLGLVRNYYAGIESFNPRQRAAEHRKQQEELLEMIGRKLRNPIKRWYVRRLVDRFQIGARLRENWKNEAIRFIAWLRKWLLELGQRLCAAGMLEWTEDIFFLTLDELPAAARGQDRDPLRAAIETRVAEYRYYQSLRPPSLIFGRFDAALCRPQKVDSTTRLFHGISVYPGKVTGPARVILRADDKTQVLPGEILVAPFTDPGWTPYFVTAAGVVMDLGGLLSHGSIIAREFGIPAVVNVGPATQVIRTGQTIQVDADEGKVVILD